MPNAPSRHSVLASAFKKGLNNGLMRHVSPLDNDDKIAAYRRVGTYPIYAVADFSIDDVRLAWWRRDVSIAVIALLPCIGLWLLIGFSLRRLKAEEAAWHNWRGKLALRRSAEATTQRMQRMDALGNLVANVAHDFSNLLMVVTSNMEIARRKDYNGVRNEINAVERASSSARALARRLISVACRQPLQQQVIRPERWLDEVELLVCSAVSSKVALDAHAYEAVWAVKADPTELTSAIINIAVNAKDAMPHGGHFTVRCANVSFDARRYGLDAGEYVVITARDSGTGMMPEVARHAFEPLFTTKAPSEGTTIYAYLPRWQGEEPAEPEPASIVDAERRSGVRTVLLVEDNEEVAAGLMAVLEVLGWHAHHEPTGDVALKVLEQGDEFDLVLSDVQMPGTCDSVELVEWIRKRRSKQAVTLMTGYVDHLAEARRLGVAVLAKPFNADDLKALLSGLPVSAAE